MDKCRLVGVTEERLIELQKKEALLGEMMFYVKSSKHISRAYADTIVEENHYYSLDTDITEKYIDRYTHIVEADK